MCASPNHISIAFCRFVGRHRNVVSSWCASDPESVSAFRAAHAVNISN